MEGSIMGGSTVSIKCQTKNPQLCYYPDGLMVTLSVFQVRVHWMESHLGHANFFFSWIGKATHCTLFFLLWMWLAFLKKKCESQHDFKCQLPRRHITN